MAASVSVSGRDLSVARDGLCSMHMDMAGGRRGICEIRDVRRVLVTYFRYRTADVYYACVCVNVSPVHNHDIGEVYTLNT